MNTIRKELGIDIETYSETDISDCGLYRYCEDPSFQVLLFGYAYPGHEPTVIDLAQGEQIPEKLLRDLFDPTVLKTAFNAAFEINCLAKHFDTNPVGWSGQWECTQVRALYAGYCSGLGNVSQAMGFDADRAKDAAGKALIKRFCVPHKPTKKDPRTRIMPWDDPDAWERFKAYNGHDVVAEGAIREELKDYPLPDMERNAWLLDFKLNASGIYVDKGLVDAALEIDAKEKGRLGDDIKEKTGVANPKSGAQLKGWLSEQMERDITSLTKETIPELITECELFGDTDAAEVLKMYTEFNKTSLSKYSAIDRMINADGRIRGIYQFYGARTGRWAGRGVQVHNLPRTYMEDLEEARQVMRTGDPDALRLMYGNATNVASELIRTVFIPTPGTIFSVADYSAIEARVIAWLSGEQWRLDVFHTHGKIYEASASQMFNVPIERIKKGNPEYSLRAHGKVAELALGYAGGVGALERMDYKKEIDPSEYIKIRDKWRAKSPKICRFWYDVEAAAIEAVERQKESDVGCIHFRSDTNALIIDLPSGRSLYYVNPGVASGRLYFYGYSLGKWKKQDTYGGKLVENIVQAVARDCLSEALLRLDANGYDVKFHVHDEIIAEVPPGDTKLTNENMIRIMCETPAWAEGLPLNAAGFESEFYMKD